MRDIGTFLQQFYIYAVEWVDSGDRRRHARQGAREPRSRRSRRLRPSKETATMKVMIRRGEKGLSAYVPKKDLEEPIVETERETLWGGSVKLQQRLDADPAGDARRDAAADHRQRAEARRGRMSATLAELGPARAASVRAPRRLRWSAISSCGTPSFPISAPECSRSPVPRRRRRKRSPRRSTPGRPRRPASAPTCGRSRSSSRAGIIARPCRSSWPIFSRARSPHPRSSRFSPACLSRLVVNSWYDDGIRRPH